MTRPMQGKCVLVVEDEYLLADDMRGALEGAGAEVVGPVPDTAAALALIAGGDRIDAALLDVNLGGTSVFPVADALTARAIPFAFATGFDRSALPERFADAARLEKPIRSRDLATAVARLLS